MGILDAPTIQRATIGARLRAAARAPLPLLHRPWLATPLWTDGETVHQGVVRRTAAGQLYVSLSNATCGATEPTHLNASSPSDGGVLWSHLGPLQGDSADDANPPALTITGNATTPSGLTIIYSAAVPQLLQFFGLDADVYATNYLRPKSWDISAGNANRGECSVSFMTDAPRVGIQAENSVPNGLAIRINNRDLWRGARMGGLGTNNWADITFAGAEVRKITIDFPKDNSTVMAIAVPVGYSVWPYSMPDRIKAALVADSFQDGSNYGPFLPGNTLSQCLGRLLGLEELRPFARGGTGLINKGAGSAFFNYVERVDQVLAYGPEVLFTYGSTNDNTQTQAAITAAATAYMDALLAGGFRGPHIWLGPVPLLPATTPNIAVVDAGIAAACAGRANVYYRSTLSAVPPWLTGGDNNAGYTWSQTRASIIGGDNVHPVDKGTQLLASRWASDCMGVVYPQIR